MTLKLSEELFQKAIFEESNIQKIALVTSSIGLNKDNPIFYFYRGTIYEKEEKNELALSDYKLALSLDEKNENYIGHIGILLINMDRYSEAEEYFQKLLSLNENDVNAFIGLGYIHVNKGDYDKAIEPL